MSGTKSVGLGGTDLWAYDASLSLLLAELIGLVDEQDPGHRPLWWAAVQRELRIQAVISDFHLDLDLGLDATQRDEFASLLEEATRRVLLRGTFTSEEANRWRLLGDQTVLFRGSHPLETIVVAELGEAIVALLRGRLSPAPQGTSWFLGGPGGRRTIGRQAT